MTKDIPVKILRYDALVCNLHCIMIDQIQVVAWSIFSDCFVLYYLVLCLHLSVCPQLWDLVFVHDSSAHFHSHFNKILLLINQIPCQACLPHIKLHCPLNVSMLISPFVSCYSIDHLLIWQIHLKVSSCYNFQIQYLLGEIPLLLCTGSSQLNSW